MLGPGEFLKRADRGIGDVRGVALLAGAVLPRGRGVTAAGGLGAWFVCLKDGRTLTLNLEIWHAMAHARVGFVFGFGAAVVVEVLGIRALLGSRARVRRRLVAIEDFCTTLGGGVGVALVGKCATRLGRRDRHLLARAKRRFARGEATRLHEIIDHGLDMLGRWAFGAAWVRVVGHRVVGGVLLAGEAVLAGLLGAGEGRVLRLHWALYSVYLILRTF